MWFLKRYRRPIRLGRDHALVGATLVGLLATSVGLPVVEPAHKDASRPFPCQGGACGCASADVCWRSCCCMSPRQRVTWANDHGVRPPEELLAQARQSMPNDATASDSGPAQSDGQKHATVSGTSITAGSSHKPCCHKDHRRVAERGATNAKCHESAAPQDEHVRFGWLVGSLVNRCRGQHSSPAGSFVALPPSSTVSWSFDWHVVQPAPSMLVQFSSLSFPPPVPPPRA